MIANLLLKMGKRRKQDLFHRTRNKLTLLYSGLLILFLGLFVMIVYFLVNSIIFSQQEHQILSLAEQEAKLIQSSMATNNSIDQQELDNLNFIQGRENQFFYYMIDKYGKLIVGDEVIHPLRSKLVDLGNGWKPEPNEIRYETINVPHRKSDPDSSKHDIHLIVVGRPIYQNQQLIGTFYTGKDISFYYELRSQLLWILIILMVIFIGIALIVSHLMSKRAMIPIMQSYTRQREFVADASHELRTPLSVLLSSINVLEMEDEFSDFSRNMMANMKDEVKRITKLVADLLTLARSDSNELKLNSEWFDMSQAAEKLIEKIQLLAQAKHMKLSFDGPGSLRFFGDQERLIQLLYILMDNAIKYTPDNGEVRLTLSVETERHQQLLCMEVQDTGIGINKEDQEQIFNRFYRVDKARSRQKGGHGLGLSIAKWIVDAHKGKIQVNSEIDKGTSFLIKIPFQDEKMIRTELIEMVSS
jgi:signal transduction histidine kinase